MLVGDQAQGRDCERSALQAGTLIVDFSSKASAGRVIRDCARWSSPFARHGQPSWLAVGRANMAGRMIMGLIDCSEADGDHCEEMRKASVSGRETGWSEVRQFFKSINNDHRIASSEAYDGPARANRYSVIYHWPRCQL
jgi:hypothetical protein